MKGAKIVSTIILAAVLVLLSFNADSDSVLGYIDYEDINREMSVESTVQKEIWPMDGSFVYEAAVTLADIEGDGNKEVIVGGRSVNADGTLACSGKVYVYHADGTLMWEKVVRAGVNSSAAVSDINGDGVKDIVVGMGAWHHNDVKYEDASNECGAGNPNAFGNGGVVALDGRNGNQLWVFNTQDWGEWGMSSDGEIMHGAANGVLDGVYSSPVIGDVTGNGEPEIAFGSWDNCIYLLDKNGHSLWGREPFDYSNPDAGLDFCGGRGFFNHDTVWSSPALADLTGDGKLEIVIGGDISCDVYGDPDLCNRYMEPDGGHLWVIRADGTPLARRWVEQAVQSSPAVADLDSDGVLDIVVGTGQAFAEKGYFVAAWTFDDSLPLTEALVRKWKTGVVGRTFSSPAIGDLDGDGILDVVTIIKYGEWGIPIGPSPDNGSYAYAFRGSDGALLWKTHICNNDSIGRSFPINASPVLADITGDTLPEVFFPHAWEIGVLNSDGTYFSKVNTANGCTDTTGDALYNGSGSFTGSVAIGDLNGDDTLELVAPGRLNEASGSLYGGVYVWSGHTSSSQPIPWGMFRQNPSHTGNLTPPLLELSTNALTMDFVPGEVPQDVEVRVLNGNPGSFLSWSAEIDWTGARVANWFSLSKYDGEVVNSDVLKIQVKADKVVEPGLYVGTIVFEGCDFTQDGPKQVRVEYEVPPPTLEIEQSQAVLLVDPSNADSVSYSVGISNSGGGGAIEWEAQVDSCSWLAITPDVGSTSNESCTNLVVDVLDLQSGSSLKEGWETTTVTVKAITPGVVDAIQTIEVKAYVGELSYVHLPMVTRP